MASVRVFAIAGLLVSTGLAAQQPQAAWLTVWVGDQTGACIHGALVEVDPRSGDHPYAVKTNEQGWAAFSVMPGRYLVQASREGFKNWKGTIDAVEGGDQTIMAVLEVRPNIDFWYVDRLAPTPLFLDSPLPLQPLDQIDHLPAREIRRSHWWSVRDRVTNSKPAQ